MPCTYCLGARLSPKYPPLVFDPRCLWCGARYLQVLKRGPPETRDERQALMRGVLDTWGRQGHDREQLRDLAKDAKPALEPVRGKQEVEA